MEEDNELIETDSDTEQRDDGPGIVLTDAEMVDEARKAYGRVNKTTAQLWSDWLLVGTGLVIGREHVLDITGSNRPKGSRYNVAFGKWLGENGLSNMDEATRARLLSIMEIEDEIEEWRSSLKPNEQYRLNHPVTVWNNYKAHLRREGHHDEKPPKKQAQSEANVILQDENDRLRQQVEDLQTEINRGGVDERDTLDEVVDAIDKRFENPDLESLIDGLITMAHQRGIKKTWGRKKTAEPEPEPELSEEVS